MYRTLRYLALYLAVLLLQVFLFDNLSFGFYFSPLIYLAVILLLPLDTPPIVLLAAGAAVGISMDWAMGTAGINTIATLPTAFLRPTLLRLLYDDEKVREGGTPSPERMGRAVFFRYAAVCTLFHHTIFFLFDALSWALLPQTLLRIALSSAATLAAVWLLMRIFTAKHPARI